MQEKYLQIDFNELEFNRNNGFSWVVQLWTHHSRIPVPSVFYDGQFQNLHPRPFESFDDYKERIFSLIREIEGKFGYPAEITFPSIEAFNYARELVDAEPIAEEIGKILDL